MSPFKSLVVVASILGGTQVLPAADPVPIVFTRAPRQQEWRTERRQANTYPAPDPATSQLVLRSPDGRLEVLTKDFAVAAGPSISWDGKRLLFSGRRLRSDHNDIWEMDLATREVRQITRDHGDCREPRYLAPSAINYPDFDRKVEWIVFSSDGAGTFEADTALRSRSLYATSLQAPLNQGPVTWRTTFNLSRDFSPTVLDDGRVLFTSHQTLDAAKFPLGRFPLLVSNWDGTGLNLFFSDSQGRRLKHMMSEMPDRTVVFIESDGRTEDGGGILSCVSLRRPLTSYQVLSQQPGRYRDPCPLPNGLLLVSYSSGYNPYGVYEFDFSRGAPGRPWYADNRWEALQAVAVAALREPTGLISAVEEKLPWGDLHCLSVYDSDLQEMRAVGRGGIRKVRLFQGVPAHAPNQPLQTRLLGEVPVEPDGSFFVRLPADTPFYIQAIDAQDQPRVTMRQWIWVRRGTSRGCIGCHENRELAPENRVSDAVRKGKPVDLLPDPKQ